MSIKKQELLKILAAEKYECNSFKELANGDIELELTVVDSNQNHLQRIKDLEAKHEQTKKCLIDVLKAVKDISNTFQDLLACIKDNRIRRLKN